MASSSKHLGPRFYDYLNGLREEFELSWAKTSRPRRFNCYLDGLKCEFELMTEDIESLRKERDEFKVKFEAQALELRNVGDNVICRRCTEGTGTRTSTSQIIASSPLKTPASSCSTPVIELYSQMSKPVNPFAGISRNTLSLLETSKTAPSPTPASVIKSLQKSNVFSPVEPFPSLSQKIASFPSKTSEIAPSSSSLSVVQPISLQKPDNPSCVVSSCRRTLRPSTQRIPVTQKFHSAITPTRPSQSAICPIDPIVSHSQTVTPSPVPRQTPGSTIDPDSGPGVELSIEMAHALPHMEEMRYVKFSQNGKYLAAGCQDGKAYVYDVETGNLIRVLRNPLSKKAGIRAVCFSRDGKYLATASKNKSIYIWEINTKYLRNAFKGRTSSIRSLDFSPNGRLLVSALDDNTIRLWNMRDGAARDFTDETIMLPDFSHFYSTVFSPDGGFLAASHGDGVVRVWRAHTGQLIRRFRVEAYDKIAYNVEFTPDGKGLVSGGGDMTLKYWDISCWNPTFIRARSKPSDLNQSISALDQQTRPEQEYSGHKGSICSLSISPDSRWVASASLDETVRIWDTRSGAMQHCLIHNDWVYSVDFSPTGHYLASGEYDGTVRIWRYSHISPSSNQVPKA